MPWKNRVVAVIGALILSGGGITVGIWQNQTGSLPPPPGQANLWIGAAGSCSRQVPAGAYDPTKSCGTFPAAYSAAACGDLVLVKSGTYASQDIWQSAKTCTGGCRDAATFRDGTTSARDVSGCVHIQAETSGSCTVIVNGTTSRAMTISDPYIWLDGICTTLPTDTFSEPGIFIGADPSVHGGTCIGWAGGQGVHDVLVTSAKASVINVQSSSYVYVEDSSFGPHYAVYQNGSTGTASGTSQISGCKTSSTDFTHPDHTVFLRDTWHDYWEDTVPPEVQRPHTECVHWDDGNYGVIAQSVFVNCDQYSISVENQNNVNPAVDYLLVENNLFEPLGTAPAGYTAGLIKTFNYACHTAPGSVSHSTLRFNSFDVSTLVGSQNDAGAGCATTDNDVYGNIMPGPSSGQCAGFTSFGITFHDNVFHLSNVCGTNNDYGVDFATVYTNAAALNYTEVNGSPSIDYVPDADANAGNPVNGDIVATTRPQGAHKDAGAYER